MSDDLVLSRPYVEQMLAAYRRDANAVPVEWRRYFDEAQGNGAEKSQQVIVQPSKDGVPTASPTVPLPTATVDDYRLQCLADDVVHAYRVRGHLLAQIDPLGMRRVDVPELDPGHYGLSEADLLRPLPTSRDRHGQPTTMKAIVDRLRTIYCGSIGVQYMHLDDLEARTWLQDRIERSVGREKLSHDMQLRILTRLTDSVLFEEAVRKKYVGAKTFSLEGSETLIPLLDLAIEKAASQGVREIVLGMGHRGRLNVLANVIGKRTQDIFWEFQDVDAPAYRHGDVRYHLGYSSDWTTADGKSVHLSLCFNPSHLEFVNPVVLGRLRAKLDRSGGGPERGLAVLIHGDAAFAGEGVVQETFNLSELPAYTVGGALHIIVNNQIGFTTPPAEARSSDYATAVAKMLQIPIFHVNGEDPDAAAETVAIALEFRERYHRDVVIDMYGYRRWGHNEEDDPSFTQPVLYREIRNHAGVRDRYLERLLTSGQVTREEAEGIADKRREAIRAAFESAQVPEFKPVMQFRGGYWSGFFGGPEPAEDVPTGIDRGHLVDIVQRLSTLPADFHVHPKLERSLVARRDMARGTRLFDWATAEIVALASLAAAGYRIRLTGQDTARGTFSQRHAVLHDYQDGHTWFPLEQFAPSRSMVTLCNSPLSEVGALGFEYGYSLDYPDALVAWEAQFGDFVNVAQVVIDQFIASAEEKWHRLSGLTLLLPHGWEGQGPEHSSARLERWLLLCANDNLQIVQPSTPAQYFHCLRRQVLRPWRKPLVVLTPKSMLRHPEATSPLEEFVTGYFRRVIPDLVAVGSPSGSAKSAISRVLLCSGKIYYDLVEARQKNERWDVAIVRLEQYCPLPWRELSEAIATYAADTPVIWVQQEPENMGAWQYLSMQWNAHAAIGRPLHHITRPAASSPASGSRRVHLAEEERLFTAAFANETIPRQPSRRQQPEDAIR
ncbi:MAG: 2-oxoglutarate dehydrogenase E1 component [Planctomycetia bacterium]|nr:2-oxoglutarate dehydrogenase E1 component [Planctomycetia bacterium]